MGIDVEIGSEDDLASIRGAPDLEEYATWLDPGTRAERLNTLTYRSASRLPGFQYVRTFAWTEALPGKYVYASSIITKEALP